MLKVHVQRVSKSLFSRTDTSILIFMIWRLKTISPEGTVDNSQISRDTLPGVSKLKNRYQVMAVMNLDEEAFTRCDDGDVVVVVIAATKDEKSMKLPRARYSRICDSSPLYSCLSVRVHSNPACYRFDEADSDMPCARWS